MKNKFSRLTLLIIICAASIHNNYAQETVKPVSEKERIKSSSIKSETQWVTTFKDGKETKYKAIYREFNKEGDVTKMITYSSDGTIMTEAEHVYNELGQAVKTMTTKQDSTYNTTTIYKYDGEQMLGIEIFNYNGEQMIESSYEYTSEGLLHRMITKNSNYSVYMDFIYSYDENNKLLETLSYDKDGNVKAIVKLFYDENGNIIEQNTYTPEGEIIQSTKKKYNDKGIVIEEVVIDAEGRVISKIERKTDSNGNLTEEITSNPTADIKKKVVLELDKKGNILEQKMFNKNDILVSNIEYNYEYFNK